MMNRIFLTAFTCAALSLGGIFQVTLAEQPEHGHNHHATDTHKMAEEMVQKCEERLGKVKDTGASLPADLKAEFDYFLEIVGIELKALRDPNHKDPRKHARSCQRRLKKAEHIVKQHDRKIVHEKRMEERKAKAAARKAEREERKAKKEAMKAEKAAAHHDHEQLDHGKIGETTKGDSAILDEKK